jgi:hypothetical protein
MVEFDRIFTMTTKPNDQVRIEKKRMRKRKEKKE